MIEIARDYTMFSKDWGYSPYEFDKPDGKIGKHIGAHFYIGQRRGGILGYETTPCAWYERRENIIFVGQGEDHPDLIETKCRFLSQMPLG